MSKKMKAGYAWHSEGLVVPYLKKFDMKLEDGERGNIWHSRGLSVPLPAFPWNMKWKLKPFPFFHSARSCGGLLHEWILNVYDQTFIMRGNTNFQGWTLAGYWSLNLAKEWQYLTKAKHPYNVPLWGFGPTFSNVHRIWLTKFEHFEQI